MDLSGASTFFRKKAAVVEELTEYVQVVGDAKYKLKNGFDDWFFGSLPTFNNPSAPPSVALAEALFHLGFYWARIAYGHLPRDPVAWSIADDLLQKEWIESWERVGKEAWDSFRLMNAPLEELIVAPIGKDGALDHELLDMHDANLHVQLGISFSQDVHCPPYMRITVVGDPAVSFMLARIRKLQGVPWHEKDELKSLITLWDSISHTIKKEWLGIINPAEGRPRDAGELAAYRLHHEAKKIAMVSRELCRLRGDNPDHKCDHSCFDRIRKSSQNYYKHLTRDLQALTRVKTEKMR